jgi:hypothetical protein
VATFPGPLNPDQAKARKAIAAPLNGEAVVIIRKQLFPVRIAAGGQKIAQP